MQAYVFYHQKSNSMFHLIFLFKIQSHLPKASPLLYKCIYISFN